MDEKKNGNGTKTGPQQRLVHLPRMSPDLARQGAAQMALNRDQLMALTQLAPAELTRESAIIQVRLLDGLGAVMNTLAAVLDELVALREHTGYPAPGPEAGDGEAAPGEADGND